MSDSERIYLDLDPELRVWLADHEIGIADILREQGIEAEVQRAELPPQHPGERTRDLVPLVVASSVGAVAFGVTVKLVLSAISDYMSRRAVVLSHRVWWEIKPVVDEKGHPVRDKRGDPVLMRVPVGTFDEFQHSPHGSLAVSIGLEKGVDFKEERGKPGK